MIKPFASGHSYFSLPQAIFHHEDFRKLRGDDLWLYLWLCYRKTRKPSAPLIYNNKKIAEALGNHPDNIVRLRKKLKNLGLIEAEKIEDSYRYTILDPASNTPIGEPVKDLDLGNWKESDHDSVEPTIVECPPSERTSAQFAEPSQLSPADEIDRLKALYESYGEKSPEELAIDEEIRVCRKAPERKAALREKRAALEALRRDAREKVTVELQRLADLTGETG